jgi:hypothetical protein
LGERYAIKNQTLGTPVARLQMLGDRERLNERKRAEQVDLEPEYGPFAGPARGILYHREALSSPQYLPPQYLPPLASRLTPTRHLS